MSTAKATRPAFQSVELDPIDARLEARAAEKGIPTLVAPAPPPREPRPPAERDLPETSAPPRVGRAVPQEATPRKRMRGLKLELPDYAWVALKKRSAEDMVSLRYFVMNALRAKGIQIDDADMVEDGRRIRT